MKKVCMLTAVLVLTVFVLAGCGCRNSKPAATTAPTTMPTVATEQTTMPTTAATEASSSPTIQDGNGPVSTETTTGDNGQAGDVQGRSGGMIGGSGNGNMGGAGSGNGISGSITG